MPRDSKIGPMDVASLIIVHAAIVLIWLLPGLLILLTIALRYPHMVDRRWDVPFLLVAAFILSLALITVLAIPAAKMTGRYDTTAIFVFAICVVLIASLATRRQQLKSLLAQIDMSLPERLLFLLVGTMFTIMLMNGGLIDMLADAWWHMSLANKIDDAKSVFLEKQHLLGFEVENSWPVYPPLWHMNLAILSSITGRPLPLLWHVLGAYSVAFTLLSYFVLVKALSRNSYVALLSASFLCILLGGINSYFRVSTWPGNVSYIIWYFLMALTFLMVDRYGSAVERNDYNATRWFGPTGFLKSLVSVNAGLLLLAILCVSLFLGVHPAALFWCLTGFVFFGVTLSLHRGDVTDMDVDRAVFVPPTVVILSIFLLWGMYDFVANGHLVRAAWGKAITFLPVLIILLAMGFISFLNRRRAGRIPYWASWFVLTVLLLSLVDASHIIELFQKELGTGGAYRYHLPTPVDRILGETLYLPSWEHQLRGGLLFSGLLAIPLSVWLLITHNNRATAFLAGNVLLSMLTLTSPQVFTLFTKVIPLVSVYRVQLLIFHPIVIGYAVFLLLRRLRSEVVRRESA